MSKSSTDWATVAPVTVVRSGDEIFEGIYSIARSDRHQWLDADGFLSVSSSGNFIHGDVIDPELKFYLSSEDVTLSGVMMNRETGRIAWPAEGNPWSAELICDRVWRSPGEYHGSLHPPFGSGHVESFVGTWGEGADGRSIVGVWRPNRGPYSEQLPFSDYAGPYTMERDDQAEPEELVLARNGEVSFGGRRLHNVTIDFEQNRLSWPSQAACPFAADIILNEVLCPDDRVFRCGFNGTFTEGKQTGTLKGVREDLKRLIQEYSGYYNWVYSAPAGDLLRAEGGYSLNLDGSGVHIFNPTGIEIEDVFAVGDELRFRYRLEETGQVVRAVVRFASDRWVATVEEAAVHGKFRYRFHRRARESFKICLYEDSFTGGENGVAGLGGRSPQFAETYHGDYSCEAVRPGREGLEAEPLTRVRVSGPSWSDKNSVRVFDQWLIHATVTGDHQVSWSEEGSWTPFHLCPRNGCAGSLVFADGCGPNAYWPDGQKGKLFFGTLEKDGRNYQVRGKLDA